MTKHIDTTALAVGGQVFIPLDRLKKSPRNARKAGHTEADIQALAASIATKGILQNLVVEPERDEKGGETGFYLTTIGEGRRLAQRLRAERGDIEPSEPMPCVIDTENDAVEISLDENVTRFAMHPADQFEAFRALNVERGMGAEDIAARFGVTPHIVRQRLRLAAVSPVLMQVYREGELSLDQLMAFALTEDHARQEDVFKRLNGYTRDPYHIRRLLTERQVAARDRRAVYLGVDAYRAAGGHVDRDLFTEDGGGFFTDVALLDRLALEKLQAETTARQDEGGWLWSIASLDFPHSHGYRRTYPEERALSPEDQAELEAARDEYNQLSDEYEAYEELPDDIDKRMGALEAAMVRLEALGSGYDTALVARAGIIAYIGHDGTAEFNYGFVRPQDELPEPEPEGDDESQADDDTGAGEAMSDGGGAARGDDEDEPEGDSGKPLSDALVRDLTAHRTLALRFTLGEQPELAAHVLVHALALSTFYPHPESSCLDIRLNNPEIAAYADGLGDTPTAQAMQARHDAWASQMPASQEDLWNYVLALDVEALGALMAHCVSLSVTAMRHPYERRTGQHRAAERLVTAVNLDMTGHWRPTARSYFERVTKAHIKAAVHQAISYEAADRLSGMKKQAMADAAEQLVAATGWLPELLRTAPPVEPPALEDLPEVSEGLDAVDAPAPEDESPLASAAE